MNVFSKTKNAAPSEAALSAKSIAKGVIAALALTVAIFAVFAAVISFTNVSESAADAMVTIATAAGIALSGIIAAGGAQSKGWLSGAIGGFLYIFIVWLIGAVASRGFSLTERASVMFLLSVVIGAFGGIIAINVRR